METHVFLEIEDEAKDLYRAGTKNGGGMSSRQAGEPMKDYIKRRERWYGFMKHMANDYKFTDRQLGELLLDNSGLSDLQRILILSSTRNDKTWDSVKTALLEQHNKIHIPGKNVGGKDNRPHAGDKGSGKQNRPKYHPRFRRAFRCRCDRTANLADEDEGEEEEDEVFHICFKSKETHNKRRIKPRVCFYRYN